MPANAYLLLAFFVLVSIVAGVVAWRVVVPALAWGWALPLLAAFGALYLAGHRFGWSLGPVVELFGFQVSLLFDLALAFLAALVAAGVERLVSVVLGER